MEFSWNPPTPENRYAFILPAAPLYAKPVFQANMKMPCLFANRILGEQVFGQK